MSTPAKWTVPLTCAATILSGVWAQNTPALVIGGILLFFYILTDGMSL